MIIHPSLVPCPGTIRSSVRSFLISDRSVSAGGRSWVSLFLVTSRYDGMYVAPYMKIPNHIDLPRIQEIHEIL